MPQLTYDDQSVLPAFEGGLADSGPSDKVSRTPGGNVAQESTLTIGAVTTAAVAQVETLTVDTAADADAFTINIGEFEFTGTSVGTDADTQATAIRALLSLNEDILALYSVGGATADIIVTALRPGTPFTTQETVAATSAYSWAATTANTDGTQFKFIIDGRELLYAAAGTVIETERDALLVLLQADAVFAAEVVFAALSTDAITITALVAGNPHTITFENEDGIGRAGVSATETFATGTANVTGNPIPFGRGLSRGASPDLTALPSVTGFVFEGISIARAMARPKDNTVSPPVTGQAEYKGSDPVNVLRKGRIYVVPEDAITIASSVFLRFSQGTNPLHTVGRFRSDADTARADEVGAVASGAVARWLSNASAEALAILEINIP